METQGREQEPGTDARLADHLAPHGLRPPSKSDDMDAAEVPGGDYAGGKDAPGSAVPMEQEPGVTDGPAVVCRGAGHGIEILPGCRRTGIKGADVPRAGRRSSGASMVPAQDRHPGASSVGTIDAPE